MLSNNLKLTSLQLLATLSKNTDFSPFTSNNLRAPKCSTNKKKNKLKLLKLIILALEPILHITLKTWKSMNWMLKHPKNQNSWKVLKIEKSLELLTEPNISSLSKKEESLLQNGIHKTLLSGQLSKVMKIMLKYSSHKKSLDKFCWKWTKNTWKMFLES